MNLSTNAISKLINNLPKNFFKNISSNDQLIKKIYDYLLEQKVKESHSALLNSFNSFKLEYRIFKENELEKFFYIVLGSSESKARFAYKLLNPNYSKIIDLDKLKNILKLMGVNESSTNKLMLELSEDGSEDITEDNFVNFLPTNFYSHPKAYKLINKNQIKESIKTNESKSNSKPRSKKLESLKGTSPLQLQIGFFRLIQGAAYRSFRESFSANCETHLRAYDLPYSIKDFVIFVKSFIDFYLGLGIIEKEVYSVFEELKNSVIKLEKDLEYRMENWASINKTEAILEAEKNLETELFEIDNHHKLFSSLIEVVLSASLHGHEPENIIIEDLENQELNRLRHLELNAELFNSELNSKISKNKNISFKNSWQRVIVDSSNTYYEGSIIATSYWYEEFMPLLLKATAVINKNDLINWENTTEEDLNKWFDISNKKKEFDKYGKDLKESFPMLSTNKKKLIKQSWILTRHYLNGVQKRRERLEFGRESGYLSQYVAFIDIYLGRDDIEKSQMRLSFPYFIGPATWRFFHTSAEIIKNQAPNSELTSVEKFKIFFKSLATMYPCPYCRFHLNKFVVKNKEVSMYPLEYLILGTSEKFNFDISIDEKLSTFKDGKSLSLFLWKLHNTVSSSIARSEDWFHFDKNSYYTSRYWPSLDSELEKASLLNISSISTTSIARIYGVIKNTIKLSTLKDELKMYLNANLELKKIFSNSKSVSEELDESFYKSEYLEEHYTFNHLQDDEDPHFSEAEELLARSGKFTDD